MASKKEWKRRAKLAVSAQQEAEAKLESVRAILVKAELPGPSLPEWAGQLRDLLLSVGNELDLKLNPFAGFKPAVQQRIPEPTPMAGREPEPDGIYELPSLEDLDRWSGKRATRS